MPNPNTPIILIHYGDSFYLEYVVKCIKLTNPDKTIYFLGDEENAYLNKYGAIHIDFKSYLDCKSIKEFNDIFQLIAGVDHVYNKNKGTDFWVRFVFLRWFIIYEFCKKQGIEKFWTFDSDNMIVGNLGLVEKDLSKFDCTTQCRGNCMNGHVNSLAIVKGYLDKIIELFGNEDYLEIQRTNVKQYPKFAFTEMRAFYEYKRNSEIRTVHLQNWSNSSFIFDDCLVTTDPNSTFETINYSNRKIKSIYVKNGNFHFRLKSGDFKQTMNFNLSWLDDFIFRMLCMHLHTSSAKRTLSRFIFNSTFIEGSTGKICLSRNLLQRLVLKLYYKYFTL